jgi:glucose/arabinose dehydrogenase
VAEVVTLNQVRAEALLSHVSQLSTDAGRRIAGQVRDLIQRPGLPVSHQHEHPQVLAGEAGRIARFRHPSEGVAAVETVLDGLPNDGRHPHKTLALSPDGTLYFSVGSATDNCQVPNAREALDPCPERSPVAPAIAHRSFIKASVQTGDDASAAGRALRLPAWVRYAVYEETVAMDLERARAGPRENVFADK